MTDDLEIHAHKLSNKTYISRRICPQSGGPLRIASKVMDGEGYRYAIEKDELVVRKTAKRRKEIKATFFEDDRRISVLTIQSYNGEKGTPHETHFSFVGSEITRLLGFVRDIASVDLSDEAKINVTDEELRRLALSKAQATSLVHDNEELFSEVLRSEVTKADVVALGYRKRQITAFGRLLEDAKYFDEVKKVKNWRRDEDVWQGFFDKNRWIFGCGLSYISIEGLEEKKLEQIVQGHSVLHKGKRVDALMKSRGIVSALCFVEIKTHKTGLLQPTPYRSGCYAPSDELSGAVAQVQGTVAAAMKSLADMIRPTDAAGDPIGEEIYNFKPRAFLVIGSLDEFLTPEGVNAEKFRSFELYRNSIAGIEIVTFDELYQRSQFIVGS